MEDLSLWLMPTVEGARGVTETISGLAAQHDTPVFLPHVTVLSGIKAEPSDVCGQLRAAFSGKSELQLRFERIAFEDVIEQALHLVAEPDPGLLQLRRDAEAAFVEGEPEPYRPHLSLMYSSQPEAERRAIAADLTVPKLPWQASFDRVEVWWNPYREFDRWSRLDVVAEFSPAG